MNTCDFLVIGGGVIGINIARGLKRRYPQARVVVLEKESDGAQHASGRNSGVLHAGFYYTADSLKAKFTRQGNLAMTGYCERKKLKINTCGKLVVAKNREDLVMLEELLKRGTANGVPLESLSEKDAKKIEPRVRTFERALFSPSTSSVDPIEVMNAMTEDALKEGVVVKCGVQYLKRAGSSVVTTQGPIEAGYVVNAAGLYADKIALDFGFSQDYRILPFKGLYLYSHEPVGALRTNIYPVPDLRYPFLGVHFTLTVDGHTKIGPTAVPALWREQYGGWKNFRLGECAEVMWREAELFMKAGFDFRGLAWEEMKKYSRTNLVGLASELLEGVRQENYRKWGKPGIRAQLVDLKKRKLEMDFIVEGDKKSFHVLNAVSPGFTCALPFAEYVVQQIHQRLNSTV